MGIIEKLFNRRVLLWLFVPLLSFSQNFNENICFPLWTMHTYDTTIYGMSVGIHSGFDNDRYVRTNGLRMELPGLGFAAVLFYGYPIMEKISKLEEKEDYTLFELDKKEWHISEVVNGINVSSGSLGGLNYNGITIGVFAQNGVLNNGIALAGVWNSLAKSNGITASFIINETFYNRGLQLALRNTSFDMKGVQIGLINNSIKAVGLQIGGYNKSKKTRGIQIGLWNRNEKRKLPFINWNFKD